MNIRLAFTSCVTAALALASHALAQTSTPQAQTLAPDLVFAYDAGVQTEDVFRGLSQTRKRGSAFVGADATYRSQVYVGVWSSNVDTIGADNIGSAQEVDVYGGWYTTAVGFDFDLGVQYYGYIDQPRRAKVDYTEIYGKVSRSFGPLSGGAAFFYSDGYGDRAGAGYYSELNAAYAIDRKWSVSGALGAQHFDRKTVQQSYTTWNFGVAYAINRHLSLDARYHDTDNASFYGVVGRARAVLALKAVF